jgi:molybdate transport system substrate-binding protein
VGILPLALAKGTRLSERGRFWVVPAEAHPPIRHGGAIHARAIDREATVAFRDFLLSPAGRSILARYGFEFPAVP